MSNAIEVQAGIGGSSSRSSDDRIFGGAPAAARPPYNPRTNVPHPGA